MTAPDDGSSKEGPSERHQAAAVTPPTLPGEVWRGDIDGPVCVTVKSGKGKAWTWWSRDEQWVHERDRDHNPAILTAWALSLAAERDTLRVFRAEMVKSAEAWAARLADMEATLARTTRDLAEYRTADRARKSG